MESNQNPPNEGKPKKSVEDRDDLIFELIKGRYDGILENTNALETKAASLIGFVAVVVGLIVGGGTFEASTIATSYFLYIPYFASIAFLLASIFFSGKAFKEKRNLPIVPDVEVLLRRYTREHVSYSQVLRTTSATMVSHIDVLAKFNERKTNDINRSWNLLLIGLTSVLALLVFFIFREHFSQSAETLEAIIRGMRLPFVQ